MHVFALAIDRVTRLSYPGPMTARYRIRAAMATDREALLALLPQRADFDVPPRRDPAHLWQGDAALLERVLADSHTDSLSRSRSMTGIRPLA